MSLSARSDPIERRSLHHELVERLRVLINAGELKPGTKIPEKALCEKFAVSRTPLREALKVLSVEGFVKLTPNRGAAVAEFTLQDLEHVFPVIASLEALSGELVCAQISNREIDAIGELHHEMLERHRLRQRPEYFRLNQAIHEAILDAAGNPALQATHRSLAGRIARARYMANLSQPRWDQAVAEHEEILLALRARDRNRLPKLLRDHVMTKFASVKAAFAEQE
ncbi:MAG TPA: GntR family transcriptional regulator [Gammaproteobacteria bacterium]